MEKFKSTYNLIPLPTIGDGSCLIHAVLQGFNKDYEQKTDTERCAMVKEIRKDLSKILDYRIEQDKTIYQKLNRGQTEELAKIVSELDINFMKNYLDSRQFLTLYYVELISDIFDINIIFINDKDNEFYYTGDPELLIKERDTVFINYIEDTHFETLSVRKKNAFKTLFSHKEKICKDAFEILFNRGK